MPRYSDSNLLPQILDNLRTGPKIRTGFDIETGKYYVVTINENTKYPHVSLKFYKSMPLLFNVPDRDLDPVDDYRSDPLVVEVTTARDLYESVSSAGLKRRYSVEDF